MEFCKRFEYGDPSLYVFYIHGWLLPHIAQLRAQKKLELRKIEFKIEDVYFREVPEVKKGTYSGEMYQG